MTGASDSNKLTLAGSIQKLGSDGAGESIIGSYNTLGGSSTILRIRKSGLNSLGISCYDTSGNIALQVISSTDSMKVSSGRVNFVASFDLSDTTKRWLTINGVNDLSVTAYNNSTMDFTNADWAIGADADGSAKLHAILSDLRLWIGQSIDLSNSDNYKLFFDPYGRPTHPVYANAVLGQPLIDLRGPGFASNSGSGGGMTLHGTLPLSDVSPSDLGPILEMPNTSQYGNNHTAGLDLAPLYVPGGGEVIVTLGQSNITNSVNADYTPTQSNSFILNVYDGLVYKTKEPLLGCNAYTPGNSNMASRLADKLIAAGKSSVIIAAIGVGNTSAADWAYGGGCNNRIPHLALALQAAGLKATRILLQNGENESVYGATGMADNIRSIVQTFRDFGIDAPFYVAKATNLSGTYRTETRQAQTDVLSDTLGIYAGPDTDTLDTSYRQSDGIHFNATGSDAQAALWQAVLS